MADIFDVIADPTRRELLARLRDARGELSVSELVGSLELNQPTVSKHLKVLREAGLVSVREDGQHRFYKLDRAPLGELESWLEPFTAAFPASQPDDAPEFTASPVYSAWAGADVSGAGDKLGRAAADTAHAARVALESAQEKLQGAQRRVASRLPQWARFGGDDDDESVDRGRE